MISLYSESDAERVAGIVKPNVEPYRSPWRRDIARLIHCPAFRRLQGKTQVFPGGDSDFFRNRLTHSLEVAQIAKSIAIKLNATNELFAEENQKLEPDLVEFAALAHDLGHPPFGHNGEDALDAQMADYGGFEGNAQTLHILARVEKKEVSQKVEEEFLPIADDSSDLRCGLNLTYRSLAAVLKYDNRIPMRKLDRTANGEKKGYYNDEGDLVTQIKGKVLPDEYHGEFKTIECSIMDIADDIAYSTYDLEDCFKARFLTPLDLFTIDDRVKTNVVNKINARVRKYYGDDALNRPFAAQDLIDRLFLVFEGLFKIGDREKKFLVDRRASRETKKLFTSLQVKRLSESIATNGYERIQFTSQLVQSFMDGVEIVPHEKYPQLHRARLQLETFITVEVLKNITYEAIIMSPRVKLVEYRGKDIITNIFQAIDKEKGNLLLPDDYRNLYEKTNGVQQKRVICDFIAGMTDRYAWEFYNRLFGTDPISIHVPV